MTPTPSTTIVIAAVDLDDTLLRKDGTLSDFTTQILEAWLASGRRLVIATGRPARHTGATLPPILRTLPRIVYNGAEIYEGDELIFQDLIPPERVQETVEQIRICLPESITGLEIDGKLYLNRERPRALANYEICDLATLYGRAAAKILCFHEDYAQVCRALSTPLPGTRVMLSDKYRFAQVMSPTADKAHALEFIVQRWGATLPQVIAFGDDVNDVEMVRRSGIGVAVDNAVAEVKAVAARIAASHEEDGVALVLAELLN